MIENRDDVVLYIYRTTICQKWFVYLSSLC